MLRVLGRVSSHLKHEPSRAAHKRAGRGIIPWVSELESRIALTTLADVSGSFPITYSTGRNPSSPVTSTVGNCTNKPIMVR
jgi:hypothetical protein